MLLPLLLLVLLLVIQGELEHLSALRDVLQRQAELHPYSPLSSGDVCSTNKNTTFAMQNLFQYSSFSSIFAIADGLDLHKLRLQRESASAVYRQHLQPLLSHQFQQKPRFEIVFIFYFD